MKYITLIAIMFLLGIACGSGVGCSKPPEPVVEVLECQECPILKSQLDTLTAEHNALQTECNRITTDYQLLYKGIGKEEKVPELSQVEKMLEARKERMEKMREEFGGQPGYTEAGFKKPEERKPQGE